MSNMHRIQWFDKQIREGSYPNSNHLAQQFEISKRQAQRDIEYLSVSLRAPLVYVSKHRGYVYEDKAYMLPFLYITEEEKQVLQYLAFRYGQYKHDNASIVNRIGDLLSRFTEDQEAAYSGRLPVFDSKPRLIQHIQLLSNAIRECLVIQLKYWDDGKAVLEQVCPLKLTSHYNADYLVAFCERQHRQRTFLLDYIEHVAVTDSRFDRSKLDVREWEQSALPLRKPFIASVLLAHPIKGEAWNGYPIRIVEPSVYEVEFYDVDSFLQHLISTDWSKLLSPKWLREKLTNKCMSVLDRINGEEGEG